MASRQLWQDATHRRIIAIGTAQNGGAFCVYTEDDVQALMANAGSGINQEQPQKELTHGISQHRQAHLDAD